MLSPFPGMDPHLENPRRWPGVHTYLIACFNAAIARQLPSGFRSRVEERLYIAEAGRSITADALVFATAPNRRSGSSVAVAEPSVASPSRTVRLETQAVRERFVEIFLADRAEQVVTVVEILSPANKRPGAGREEYQRKQAALLSSAASLLEIDLLRAGEPVFLPERQTIEELFGAFDYAACLHRAHAGDEFQLWAWGVRERLPALTVPLTPEQPDLVVDLQAVLTDACALGALLQPEDYESPPIPPLSQADALWASALAVQ
jgi:hypothetical protein